MCAVGHGAHSLDPLKAYVPAIHGTGSEAPRVQLHTYIHTYRHTHTHTYIHTYIHTYAHGKQT